MNHMTPRPGNGAFRWNTGGWFGGQLGATAYLLLIGIVVLIDSPKDGLPILVCGLIPNLFGYYLWRRRARIRPYPAIQALLLTTFLCTLAFGAFVRWQADPRITETYFKGIEKGGWILLLFPALMLQTYYFERVNKTKAHRVPGPPNRDAEKGAG